MQPIQLFINNESDTVKKAAIFGDSEIEIEYISKFDFEGYKEFNINTIRLQFASERDINEVHKEIRNTFIYFGLKDGSALHKIRIGDFIQLGEYLSRTMLDLTGTPLLYTLNKDSVIYLNIPPKTSFTITIFQL